MQPIARLLHRSSALRPFPRALALAVAVALVPAPAHALHSVYYQQDAPVRLNGRPLPLIYTDAHDVELRADQPTLNFDGGTAGSDGTAGPDSLAVISTDDPPGNGTATAYLLRFDEIFSGKYVPIPAAAHIDSAWLVLDFVTTATSFDLYGAVASWTDATATWDNYGTPGDGVAPGIDAHFLRTAPLPVHRIAVEVTPEVIAWAGGHTPNHGWALLPTSTTLSALKTVHHRNPASVLDGTPAWIEVGLWGIRRNATALLLTDPQLLDEGAFGRPALIIYFSPPPDTPPPVFEEDEPDPPPGGGGGSGGDGGGARIGIERDGDDIVVIVRDWPDREVKVKTSKDLEDFDGELEVDEVGPGKFEGRDRNTAATDRRFYRGERVDADGDGQPDRKGGASAAVGERCPENALADLFKHIERTGRLLQDAEDEFNRNALVAEIRTVQLLWEFLKRYRAGVYAVPFDRALQGFLLGKSDLKPIRPDGTLNQGILTDAHAAQLLRDTLEYIRFMLWWRLTYDTTLSSSERDELRAFLDQLTFRIDQLKALDPLHPNFGSQLRQLQQNICQLFDLARNQPASAAGILLRKIAVWLAQKGATGLFEQMLAETFGKSFVNGTLGAVATAAQAIVDLFNTVGVHLAAGDVAAARAAFNQALSELHALAATLPKFALPRGTIATFESLHADSVHARVKSTTVRPILVRFVPDGSGVPGQGDWVPEPLRMADDALGNGLANNENDRTATPDSATPEGAKWVHEFHFEIPDLPPGTNAYVVIEVTRQLCHADGTAAPPVRENHFFGVVH